MTSSEDQFIEVFDDFKVLRLPYEQGEDKRQFSMYIFLPNAKDGLSALVGKAAYEFELLEHNLPLIQREVNDFRIPRFKFSFDLETSDMLKELGVILPFFSGVNEEGIEAAAATVAEMGEGDVDECDPTGIDFIADHPFLFLIREVSTRT
ncbi:serpin-ZX, partial [Trifolium medium]|nr:serpin-ZX [Trifolium medium]